MRANACFIFLLPSAITASFLPAIRGESVATTTISSAAAQTASTPSLNEAFGPRHAHLDLRAPQPTSPVYGVQASHIPRAYDPNPHPLNFASNLSPQYIDKREVVTGAAAGVAATAAVGATQQPTVSTYWPEVNINGKNTWVQVIYTQTFADVPDQWPSPGAGTIGYGD